MIVITLLILMQVNFDEIFFCEDSRPELVYTFIEQAVQPGAQVALKCSAVGEPPPRFRWTLDGQSIASHHE